MGVLFKASRWQDSESKVRKRAEDKYGCKCLTEEDYKSTIILMHMEEGVKKKKGGEREWKWCHIVQDF